MPSTWTPGYARSYAVILASAPSPSTVPTLKSGPSTRFPFLIANENRSIERTGGPAVRRPSVSYAPPWHGQAKPDGWAGVIVTVLYCFTAFSSTGPAGCTGQPRCTQRL